MIFYLFIFFPQEILNNQYTNSNNSTTDMQLSGFDTFLSDRRLEACMTPFPTPFLIKIIRLLKMIPPTIVNFPLPAAVKSSASFNWLSEAGHTRVHWLTATGIGPGERIQKSIRMLVCLPFIMLKIILDKSQQILLKWNIIDLRTPMYIF